MGILRAKEVRQAHIEGKGGIASMGTAQEQLRWMMEHSEDLDRNPGLKRIAEDRYNSLLDEEMRQIRRSWMRWKLFSGVGLTLCIAAALGLVYLLNFNLWVDVGAVALLMFAAAVIGESSWGSGIPRMAPWTAALVLGFHTASGAFSRAGIAGDSEVLLMAAASVAWLGAFVWVVRAKHPRVWVAVSAGTACFIGIAAWANAVTI